MSDEYSAEIYAGNTNFCPFQTRIENIDIIKKRRIFEITFCYIKIEEVTIENCLNNTSKNGNPINKTFHIITINPVKNVEKSIDTQCK